METMSEAVPEARSSETLPEARWIEGLANEPWWAEEDPGFGDGTWAGVESDDSSGHAASIPSDLDQVQPGPFLAAMLWTIDVNACSAHDRIVVLRAHQRMASHYQARMYDDIESVSAHLEIVDGDIELANQGTVAEVRAALRLTRRAADSEVAFALDLKRRLPSVWSALAAGELDVRRARTIVYATSHLPELTAREVTAAIIDAAPRLTTGQLAARLRKLCIDVDPDEADDRYEQAIDNRRVVLQPTDTGAAALLAVDLPVDRAAAAASRINHLARSLKTSEEPRTMDQLRADVLLDLLVGTEEPSSRERGVVNIHVDLATLAELTETSGDLAGYGPVVADIARQVADQQREQRWQFTVSDGATGSTLHQGTTRRRPTTNQQRVVRTRDTTCVFPGCRMPSITCDLDHRTDWAQGGLTTTENLDPLCRHDHQNKHRLGWSYRRLPSGHHEWTTKLGHTYTTVGPP